MTSPKIPSGFNCARDPLLDMDPPKYLIGLSASLRADSFDETDCAWSGVYGGVFYDELYSPALRLLGDFEECAMIAQHDARSSVPEESAIHKKHKALRGVGRAENDDLPVLVSVARLVQRHFYVTRGQDRGRYPDELGAFGADGLA